MHQAINEQVLARHHNLSKRLLVPPGDAAGDSNTIPPDPSPPDGFPGFPIAMPPPDTTPPVAKMPKSPAPKAITPIVTPLIMPSSLPLVIDTPVPIVTSQTSLALPSTSSSTLVTSIRSVSTAPASTAVPDTSSSPSANTSSKSSKGVSSGVIGGIVTVLIIIALVVIAFLVRKVHQRRRTLRRNMWGAGLVPSLENKRQTLYGPGEQPTHAMSPYGGVPNHPHLKAIAGSEMSQNPVPHSLRIPSALVSASFQPPKPYGEHNAPSDNIPASAFNNSLLSPISPFIAPPVPALGNIQSEMPANHAPAGDLAVVARTFIPSLPDELQISNGEKIRILSAYDDGWALCANTRGEQGVVPLECLDRRGGAPTEMQLQPHSGIGPESNRTSRRMSSLAPAAPETY